MLGMQAGAEELDLGALESHPRWKALQAEKEQALCRAADAEARATDEACKAMQLSQERTQLMLQLSETESTLGQRLEYAETALAERLKSMDAVLKTVQAERDELARELAEYKRSAQEAANTSGILAERKQIVKDLRALKSDAEGSLEQRLEAAERELAERLQGIEARVAKAQECQAFSMPPEAQDCIDRMTREKVDLAAQLEHAWAKIEEQQRTIQEERGTFWEELDLMRMDKELAPARPERAARVLSAAQALPARPGSPSPVANGGMSRVHVPAKEAMPLPAPPPVLLAGHGAADPAAAGARREPFRAAPLQAPGAAPLRPGQRAGFYP